MKVIAVVLGFLSAMLIVSQLVIGLLILKGTPDLLKTHQHTGYLTVTVSLVYILLSLSIIVAPKRR